MALGVIGAAISDNDRDDRNRNDDRSDDRGRGGGRDNGHSHGGANAHLRDLVPSRCLRLTGWGDDEHRYYGRRCLNRHMDRAHLLPDRCEIQVETDRGTRPGYRPRCLRRHGFRLQ